MTSTMKEAAEMYALGCISAVDVTWLLAHNNEQYKSFEELPKEFHDYVENYSANYNEWVAAKARSPRI